jgi:hypothetical protein
MQVENPLSECGIFLKDKTEDNRIEMVTGVSVTGAFI